MNSYYTSVKIPMALAERIRNSKYYQDYGFTSVSQYIMEATRRHLDRIKKEEK